VGFFGKTFNSIEGGRTPEKEKGGPSLRKLDTLSLGVLVYEGGDLVRDKIKKKRRGDEKR